MPESFAEGLVGIVLDDRYRLDAVLGEGGMGAVYRAHHLAMDRKVAVKLLKPHLTTDDNALQRFTREARSTMKVDSEHAVKVLDFGITPQGDYYMVLEYLDGRTVQRELDIDGPFSPLRTVHVAKQVLHALGAAHDKGLVHRDIKPDNILLLRMGADPDFAKVLDFGVAKLMDGAARSSKSALAITQAGMVFGTPEFMSPEQACGQPIDGRSDLYSLAATMFAMLTGCGMYKAAAPIEWLMHHARTPPPHLADGLPALAPFTALDAALQRCLAKRRDDRPKTAAHMIELLDSVEASLGAATPVGAPRGAPARTAFSPSSYIEAIDPNATLEPESRAPAVDPNATLEPESRAPAVDPIATLVPESAAATDPNARLMPASRAAAIDPNARLMPESRAAIDPNARLVPESRAAIDPNARLMPASRAAAIDPNARLMPKSRTAAGANATIGQRGFASTAGGALGDTGPTTTGLVAHVRGSRRGLWLALGAIAILAMIVTAAIVAGRKRPRDGIVAAKRTGTAMTAPLDATEAIATAEASATHDAAIVAPPDPAAGGSEAGVDAGNTDPATTGNKDKDRALAATKDPRSGGKAQVVKPRINPEVAAHVAAAEAAHRSGNRLRQLAEADAALQRDPRNVRARFLFADALIASGDLDRGCKYLRDLGKNPTAVARARQAGCPTN